ncbi:MAG TPA: hypothetical protein VGP73_02335 [Thermoanaerobaculia bacterium]
MDRKTLRPAWQPSLAPGREWTLEHLRKYLGGRSFTLYAHGSCVVWIGAGELNVAEANQRLRAVTLQHPDFRVQRHTDGNYLVTFKGGVGGLMSGEFLATHWAGLRQEARTLGILPSEKLLVDRHDDAEELDMIAGLYVRAHLYRDVDELVVAATVRRSYAEISGES